MYLRLAICRHVQCSLLASTVVFSSRCAGRTEGKGKSGPSEAFVSLSREAAVQLAIDALVDLVAIFEVSRWHTFSMMGRLG